MRRVHVVGAGLAGLAAALSLSARGHRVILSDAAAQAGGRCRSYVDPRLGMRIDNGNHLVLSGNSGVSAYLAEIGATHGLAGPDNADFPFVDLANAERWTLRPNAGRFPWWILSAERRVPGTGFSDYLALARLASAGNRVRIADVIETGGPLWERLLAPLLVAVLNTPPAEASAALAGAVVRETLARGGRASLPRIAVPDLSSTFIDPAVACLQRRGSELRLGRRLRAIRFDGDRVAALIFTDGEERVAEGEAVVLAVPPWIAAELISSITVPDRHHAIVNAHFAIAPPRGAPAMTGVVHGMSEWIFTFPDRLSVTISAADRLCDMERETLAREIWAEVAAVMQVDATLPPWQIVRERRATFAATPDQDARRPGARTGWRNLVLAGDWTQTGLPATIEGAIRSGRTAGAMLKETL